MSIHDNDDAQKSTVEERAGLGNQNQQRTQYEQPAAAAQQQRRGGSVLDVNSRMQRRVGRTTTGESVTKYVNALKEVLKAEGAEEDFKLLILDKQTRMSAMSAIILVGTVQHKGKTIAAAHTMIVEATGPTRLMNRSQTFQTTTGSKEVNIPATAGDTADDLTWRKVNDVVSEHFEGCEINDAGFVVLPKELDAADSDRIHNVLFNGAAAVQTILDNAIGGVEEPFAISWIEQQDILSARVDYNPLPVETCSGLPVRSDISILLSVNRANQLNPMHAAALDFSRVDGFVELVYSPPGAPVYGQQPSLRHYYPKFVITNNQPLLNAVTLELQLLSLVSATLLTRNLAWAGTFKPRAGREVNLRNIGAIGLEIPQLVGSTDGKGAMIDTQASDFDMQKLYTLVDAAIHPELVYSLHVEETGDLSWLQSVFAAAAAGTTEAYDVIIQAANNLTDGRFNNHFKGGPIVHEENNRVHLGYWIDGNGEKRDIRDINYLALLNWVGGKDMKVVVDWCDTFDQVDVPLELRMDRRLDILQSVVGEGSLRLTGYARPYTIDPLFMQALANAATEDGLVIKPDRMNLEFQGGAARGNANIGRFAMGQVNSNMFTQQQQWSGHRSATPNMGRWGRRS